jgi:hypothetical protein
MANAITVIAPYRYNGLWVFDDGSKGLDREPFVCGIPEMIDFLTQNIPDAKRGFLLLFSATPFPGYQKRLVWQREDGVGNRYACNDPPMEGWLCPALLCYFQEAPAELYVKAEAKKAG